jgi:hypothetical protein
MGNEKLISVREGNAIWTRTTRMKNPISLRLAANVWREAPNWRKLEGSRLF